MLLLSQAPNGALSARRCPSSSSLLPFSNPNPPLFSKSRPRLPSRSPRKPPTLSLATADGAGDPGPSARPLATPFPTREDDTAVVGAEGVPLEGVIQAERLGAPSQLLSWAQVALLAGGDVLCLLVFSAIGRFSHGFPVLDVETIRTADPFIAGWVLSAYFLGGYGDDGRGTNGSTEAIAAAAKSWAIGVPLGIAIRAATSGHIPQTAFMLVAMGSTGVLLIGWRALVCSLLRSTQSKRNEVYKRGSPFELFESDASDVHALRIAAPIASQAQKEKLLLTSLVRRW